MALKLGLVLSIDNTSFSSIAYTGLLSENAAKIRAIGYDGVELAVRDPGLVNLKEIQKVMRDNGLVVPALGTGQAFVEEGLSFTDPDPHVRKMAIDRIRKHMDLAGELDTIVIIGLIRGGLLKTVEKEQAEEWLLEALCTCSDSNQDVKLAIEPINRYECALVQTVSEGIDLVKQTGRENIGLLLDTFHMNIEEPSFNDSISEAGNLIYHFHAADSNRWYPGAGHLDFEAIINSLESTGYGGFVSAEILPLPDPDRAAAGAYETLSKFQ